MTDTPAKPAKEEIQALFDAIEYGRLDEARKVIAARPDAVNWENDIGCSPLQWAALSMLNEGMQEFAMELIEKGANPNKFQPIPYGSPMILFVLGHTGGEDLALKLIEKGADLDWKSEPGSEKQIEELAERSSIIKFISGHSTTLLMSAAAAGAVRLATALLDKGADIHARDSRGQTALMYAAQSGKPDITELLISRGANIADENYEGKTMRQIAEDGLKKCSVPALEEAFRHVSEVVVPAMHAGSEKPINVSRKPIQFKRKP